MLFSFLTYELLLFFALILPAGKLINSENSEFIRYDTGGFKWNTRIAFILVLIVFIAGIREVDEGIDYINYLRFYNYILEHGEIGKHFKANEIGWDYFNLTFGKLGIPAGVFFGLVSGVTWFFFIKGSYRFQFLLPLMFFFVMAGGFFFWTFSGLRQSISIMIFFYAIKFLAEKDPLRYVIWISIASLFHISVIIMLPLYFIKDVKFNRRLVAILYIASIFLAGNSWFLSKMGDLIILISSQVDLLSMYARHYLEGDMFTENKDRTSSGLGILVRIATTGYIIYKSDYVLKKQPKLRIYYILFFIGAILSNVFLAVEAIGRILHYFNFLFPIVIASTIYYSTDKYDRVVNVLIIGVYFIMFNKMIL